MSGQASELARRLAREAEAVCRRYLNNGRRQGSYWTVGDIHNTSGRSLYVRLKGGESGPGAAGKWSEYVAPRVMLRIYDWMLSHRRLTASTQHKTARCGRLRDAPRRFRTPMPRATWRSRH
jgi:hypothetical protein